MPCAPPLTELLHQHLVEFGTADRRAADPERAGDDLSDSTYGRVWQTARVEAFTPGAASPFARRPYDLRHATVSTWLNGGVPLSRSPSGRVTAWPSCSGPTLQCVAGQGDVAREQIGRPLGLS